MKYPFSKEQYLSVQDKLYDAITYILKEGKIANIDYKLIDRDVFYTPNVDIIKNRRYTANINAWLNEIRELKGNIIEELALFLAYDRIKDDFNSPLQGTLKYVNRERYLKLALYDLFTFNEKLAYLIHEIFNRQIRIKDRNGEKLKKLERQDVSFEKIINGLKIFDITKENISWIDDSEFKLIYSVVKGFKTSSKNLKNIRNAFTHRSNPGIDCLALRSYEYKEFNEETSKRFLSSNKSVDTGKSENIKYIVKSSKPLEREYKSEYIIDEILEVWKVYVYGLKNLLENISILKNEIECLY